MVGSGIVGASCAYAASSLGAELAAALARAAVRRGAVVRDGEADLARGSGRVAGVRLGSELIEGNAVVAATGAWTRSFLQAAGLAVPVEAQRGQIMHISLGEVDTSRWPVVLPGASGHYLLAFDGGRIVAGATRETGSGFDYRITPAGLAEILEQALAVAPGLADGTYLETRVGFRRWAPDIRPLLGPVPGLDGLVVIATGVGASGLMTVGQLAGSLAAQAALGLAGPPSLPGAPPPRCPGRQPVGNPRPPGCGHPGRSRLGVRRLSGRGRALRTGTAGQ